MSKNTRYKVVVQDFDKIESKYDGLDEEEARMVYDRLVTEGKWAIIEFSSYKMKISPMTVISTWVKSS